MVERKYLIYRSVEKNVQIVTVNSERNKYNF